MPQKIGIVAIGRNEGQRLQRCLVSLRREAPTSPIVYVDSASTDGSAQWARERGALVVDLDLSKKFTAARARNEGFALLIEHFPEVEHVQFVDGDCEVEAGWLQTASARLDERDGLAVVCGRRRERFPEATVYNRLCDLEWDTPVGDVKSCGGDAMFSVRAFGEVQGYRDSLIAGEEPELCIRLRKKGYVVERIDAPMTIHDAAMTKFSQWFKRAKRSGHATAERAALYGRDPDRPGVKQTASNLMWGLGVPTAVALGALVVGPGVASASGAGAYGYLAYKSYRYERRRRPPEAARLFAASCVVGKLPEALGAVSYLANRVRGRQSVLIEYKGAEPSEGRP